MRACFVVLWLLVVLVVIPRASFAQGVMEWNINESVPDPYAEYLDELLGVVYPVIVRFYGEPSFTHTVEIRYDSTEFGGYYDPYDDMITLGSLPNGGMGSTSPDPDWDYFVIHEFTHAFHSQYYFSSWIEEGMTETCTMLTSTYLLNEGIRPVAGWDYSQRMLWYDTFVNLDVDGLGGVEWSPLYADWVSGAESYSSLFFLLLISQVDGPLWSWDQYDAMARLNARLHEEPMGVVSDEAMVDIIAETLTGEIDGEAIGDWVEAQPIAVMTDQEGYFLGIYPSYGGAPRLAGESPVNPTKLTFFGFEWGPAPDIPGYRAQLPLDGGETVEISITDISGSEVWSGSAELAIEFPTYQCGNSIALPDTSLWTPGAYSIDASVTVDGELLRGRNYFLAGWPPVRNGEDGLALITVDDDGELIVDDWESPDCEVVESTGGGLLLSLPSREQLPASCTVRSLTDAAYEHTVTIPLPATRVLTVTGPHRGEEVEPEVGADADAPFDGGVEELDADVQSDSGLPDSGPEDSGPEDSGSPEPNDDTSNGCGCDVGGVSSSGLSRALRSLLQ